jgi:hypothetical protein
LLSLAMLIASGRLVPRLLQRLNPTVSDSFLLASIINAIGLFITDAMTYKWGGMASDDAPEPPEDRLIALKKVNHSLVPSDTQLRIPSGTICWQCLLRYRYLLAKAGHPGNVLPFLILCRCYEKCFMQSPFSLAVP